MPTDVDCTSIAERLEASFWSRSDASRADLEHAAGCPSCGELIEALGTIANSLAAFQLPELGADRARSIRFRVARELAGSAIAPRAIAPAALPSGYARELVRILGWALLPLPLALFAYVQLFQLGGAVLESVLPVWGVQAVGIAAAGAAASWLAVVYGSIPLVAYRRLSVAANEHPLSLHARFEGRT